MKYIYLFIFVISTNLLIAQENVLIKYDQELLFKDSISLEEYWNYFKINYLANSYRKIDKRTLVERDIYHIIYSSDSMATKKTFRINEYHEIIDTSFFTKNTFFYFQKGDKIFIRCLEYNEPKYRLQYNLKASTRAKRSMGYYNNSYFHSEDYIYISNIKYECYVFEEINDNYRELVYIGKENGFLLKTITFLYDNEIDIVEAYEIVKINTQE
jgi:hypothetical protein